MKNKKLSVCESFVDWYFNLPIIYIDIKDYTEHFNEITDQAYVDSVRIVPVFDLSTLDKEVYSDNYRTPF